MYVFIIIIIIIIMQFLTRHVSVIDDEIAGAEVTWNYAYDVHNVFSFFLKVLVVTYKLPVMSRGRVFQIRGAL